MAEMKSDETDSKKENNLFRLYFLCQKIATTAVRLFFDTKVPGQTLQSFLRQHKSYLTDRFNACRCTKDQEKKLFPGDQVVVASTDFDFTLLYKLIRNCLPDIPAPACGWGDSPFYWNLNETDDIERIRNIRNILSHNSELRICDTDFAFHWNDLSQAILRLSKGALSTDVESIRTKTFSKCIKHELDELRNELKELREEIMDCSSHNANNRRKTELTHHLHNGRFEITPLAYRVSTVHMSRGFWSLSMWSNHKRTPLKLREITEDNKTYFHILLADHPEYYVTMGKWYVKCKQGNPTGIIGATWDIAWSAYINDDSYVLCTKDGKYLTAGSTHRMHGKRGYINERSRFLLRRVN